MKEFLWFCAATALVVLWSQKSSLKKLVDKLREELILVRVTSDSNLEKAEADRTAHVQMLESAHKDAVDRLHQEVARLQAENAVLSPYRAVVDIKAEMDRIREIGERDKERMKADGLRERNMLISEAKLIKEQSLEQARDRREKLESLMADANRQAAQIIADAKASAEQVAGDSYRALKEADSLKETATAMRNVIEGYGDRYLKPTYSLLDELAETYGFDEAGKQLKLARARTQLMVESGRAASCEYVEATRSATAIHFVVDAFNGKVDSILSRSKTDNYGTLERQIRDACALVNANGAAFRNARITDEYLLARLEELRWVTAVHVLREKEREEQRAIRERIREEERVRKEIDRALKDAAKEEEMLERAMEKVRQQVAKASEDQKQKFEADLQVLQLRLQEAEARSQRALSMAQQTRAGHVYIISNIGSFGESVFKVGMTRRLEPMDRIRELGDASVPFAFDVHAMIWSDDAPALERALHMEFVKTQLNKVNPRKEFFKVGISSIRDAIEKRGIEASWTMAAAAIEYRESLAIEARMNESDAVAADWVHKQSVYQFSDESVVEDETVS